MVNHAHPYNMMIVVGQIVLLLILLQYHDRILVVDERVVYDVDKTEGCFINIEHYGCKRDRIDKEK